MICAAGVDEASLFLDLDGTLADIMSRPEDVAPEPRRTAVLRRLHDRLGGRVAIISGRPVGEVDGIVQTATTAVAGSHGLERRGVDGVVVAAAPHPHLPRARAACQAFVDANPAVLLEVKPLGLALHFREAPAMAAAATRHALAVARETGLAVQHGHAVVELRTPGADKGDAVRAFLAEPPFAGSTPIFVGDDKTDEAGFAAARECGGWGILVGDVRPTLAVARLSDPDRVLGWLDESLQRGVFQVEETL
jgi:trehalose 6-phosphate phosphatase